MKKFLSLFFVVLMCVTMILPLYATKEAISPRFNNTATTTADFSINSNGLATVTLRYSGYSNCTTGATVTCKIEKKILFLWMPVEGAEWADSVEGTSNVVQHSYQLPTTGKYKLTYEITVYGTGGDPDVISSTIEKEY